MENTILFPSWKSWVYNFVRLQFLRRKESCWLFFLLHTWLCLIWMYAYMMFPHYLNGRLREKSYGRNCSAIKSWIVKLVEIVVWERERKKAYVCNFSRCCTKTIWTLELPCTTRNRSGYFSRASVDTHITYIHSFFIGYMPSSNSFTSITSAVSPLLNIFCSGQKFLNRQKREKSQNWNWKKEDCWWMKDRQRENAGGLVLRWSWRGSHTAFMIPYIYSLQNIYVARSNLTFPPWSF